MKKKTKIFLTISVVFLFLVSGYFILSYAMMPKIFSSCPFCDPAIVEY